MISYLRSHIIREELNYYPNKSKSLFYERDFVSNDGGSLVSLLKEISQDEKKKEFFIQMLKKATATHFLAVKIWIFEILFVILRTINMN